MTLNAEQYTQYECGTIADKGGNIRIMEALYTVRPVVRLFSGDGIEFARVDVGDFDKINDLFARRGMCAPYLKFSTAP
jgi:hypothetical protein